VHGRPDPRAAILIRSYPVSEASLPADLATQVARALAEDLGTGDLTAALVPDVQSITARLVTRTPMVLCGAAWLDETFRQLDPAVNVQWRASDGDALAAGAELCVLHGRARAILTGERTALNFVQTLSGTATAASRYVAAVAGTRCRILDTRKTLPGMRLAQKYAVRCGGGQNHRLGLYDMVLIKENHIAAAGSIASAVASARRLSPGVAVEVEVESLQELSLALDAGADLIMLDELSLEDMRTAVRERDARRSPARLEASGGVSLTTVRDIAATGIDYISVGGITKNLEAADLSLRVEFSG
jgi:nicotinate-nucleotide pyrophosphorylase (carboxylating)